MTNESTSHLAKLAEHAATILRGDAEEQVAALCHRRRADGKTEVLLITTRDTKRWAIPKGWPIKGLKPYQAAEREAWEEAGVKGRIDRDVFGHYSYLKRLKTETVPSIVEIHLLEVLKVSKRFPERKERSLRWLLPDEAAGLVDEPELAHMIAKLQLPSVGAPSADDLAQPSQVRSPTA